MSCGWVKEGPAADNRYDRIFMILANVKIANPSRLITCIVYNYIFIRLPHLYHLWTQVLKCKNSHMDNLHAISVHCIYHHLHSQCYYGYKIYGNVFSAHFIHLNYIHKATQNTPRSSSYSLKYDYWSGGTYCPTWTTRLLLILLLVYLKGRQTEEEIRFNLNLAAKAKEIGWNAKRTKYCGACCKVTIMRWRSYHTMRVKERTKFNLPSA